MSEANSLGVYGIVTLLVFAFGRYYIREHLAQPPLPAISWDALCNANAESRLACGRKLSLQTATLDELELLPGLGGTLAERIYQQREEILTKAHGLAVPEQHKALELVHAVGPKTAERLRPYIDLNQISLSPEATGIPGGTSIQASSKFPSVANISK